MPIVAEIFDVLMILNQFCSHPPNPALMSTHNFQPQNFEHGFETWVYCSILKVFYLFFILALRAFNS
jgi:hypothetical protein